MESNSRFIGNVCCSALLLPALFATLYLAVVFCLQCLGKLDELCLWGTRSEYGFCINPPWITAAQVCVILSIAGGVEAFLFVTLGTLLTPVRRKAVAWIFFFCGALIFNSIASQSLVAMYTSRDWPLFYAVFIVIALTNLSGIQSVVVINTFRKRE